MKFSFKLVTTLIAIILTVCCITTVFAAADVSAFTDFPAGSWSDAALRAGVNNGLIQGKDDGRIAPKDYITRAETATIINRAFGATVKADISQYTDVSPSKWYYAEMQKAVNMQTVQGVSSNRINPEGYITREQVFAILARALVISDTDETKLMTFADGSSVSSWARGYTAALVNRGYVNGNTENRLKPKDYITREEFAQIMHNTFKQYINGYNSVLSDATLGTTIVRTPNLTLKNLVINGDLIIADGVGNGNLNLENVKVSGRILFRGGEGKVKLTKTTVGQFVLIHDVNGVVNFLNYKDEAVFKNHIQDTKATFLKRTTGGGGSTKPEKYDVIYNANGGTVNGKATHTVNDVLSVNEGYTLDTTLTMERAGYTFLGWYIDTVSQTIITSVPAGTADVTVYAKWERAGASVLGFTLVENNQEGKKVTVKATLSTLPENIDDLAAISLYYTQTPQYMTLKEVKPVFEGTGFSYTDGAIIWINEKDPITLEELLDKNGELFEIVYTYTLSPNGDVVLSYTDKTELISSSFEEGTGYTMSDLTIPFDKSTYTVTFYDGTTKSKGSIEVKAESYVDKDEVEEILGDPADYKTQKGFTHSDVTLSDGTHIDGKVHEIYPELWYNDGTKWKIFEPEKVKIVKDTDVYLLTRYVAAYYDTDLEFRGIKLPQKEIVIPYDSNTDLWESAMDTLVATRDVVASTLYDIEFALDVDLFSAMLEKAAKTGFVDADGNILNPEVPVPLHKLLTEELIMKQIDNYIDSNINNEEFIAEILRNDTVVDMLLENKELRNKVLGNKDQRDKFLDESAINRLIVKEAVLNWIFNDSDFKQEFLNSKEAFIYIAEDLKHVLENAEIKKIILDECIKFVEEEYFNVDDGDEHSELYNYIDTKLNSRDFIDEIEEEPQLRILLKDEIKNLLLDDDTDSGADKQAKATLKEKIFTEIRNSSTFRTTVLNAVAGNDDILFAIGDVIRKDLLAGNTTYEEIVVNAIRTEFQKEGSALKASIMSMIQTQISAENSDLKTEILNAAQDPDSDIYSAIKEFARTDATLKASIKGAVKDDIKDDAKSWIEGNVSEVKDNVIAAVKGNAALLSKVLLASGYITDETEALNHANDYVTGNSLYATDIDAKIEEHFADEECTTLKGFITENYDTVYEEAYELIFDDLYVNLFDDTYEEYLGGNDADAKLEDAFDKYVSGGNLEKATDMFIEDAGRLISAVKLYIKDSDDKLKEVLAIYNSADNISSLEGAFETYINANDENLDDAFNVFVQSSAFDGFYADYISDDTRFNTLFESYYTTHVHDVAKDAYFSENKDIQSFVRNKVYEYTEILVMEYADKKLEENDHGELKATIDKLINDKFAKVVRERYFSGKEEDKQFKDTIDSLIRTEGEQLIKEYVKPDNTLSNDIKTFIKTKIDTNIDTIANQYVLGTLSKNIRELIDAEIDAHMNKLIDDYINDVEGARDTLGELVPTYAQDAVDTLKATDAFKNTISDFTSGNGVRVNEDNIMFISILSTLMGEYDYDKIMADFAPAKVKTIADKIGSELASKYVKGLLDTFVGGIKQAEESLQEDINSGIEGTEYKFTTTPRVRIYFMDDFVVSMYNKAMPKAIDKLNSKELISANPYAQKLINKNWITELLDYDSTNVSEELSGYSIKKGRYDEDYDVTDSPIMTYIDIALENTILLYDAVMWYGDKYEASIEDKLDAVSALMGTYANKANEVVMHYIKTGELPKGYTPYEITDKILDKVLGVNDKIDDAYDKGEDKYYENEDKILELVDKMKNFYTEKLDKDYTEVIDLASLSVYADGKAYPVYKILLGISDENDAFNIDTLADAIDDSDNYHGINALEKGMNKLKSKLAQFEEKDVASTHSIIRNAYKFTLSSREIKGRETGTHTVKLRRYFK